MMYRCTALVVTIVSSSFATGCGSGSPDLAERQPPTTVTPACQQAALDHAAREQYAASTAVATRCVELAPNDAQLRDMQGEMLILADDLTGAERVFQAPLAWHQDQGDLPRAALLLSQLAHVDLYATELAEPELARALREAGQGEQTRARFTKLAGRYRRSVGSAYVSRAAAAALANPLIQRPRLATSPEVALLSLDRNGLLPYP